MMEFSRREAFLTIALPVFLGVAMLVAWQLATQWWAISPVILPAPSNVVSAFFSTWATLMKHAWITGSESLLAFALATLLGVVIAALLILYGALRKAFYPHLIIFQIIPKVALAPLFVVWLGYESASRLSYAVFVSFFPVVLATMTGLTRADAGAVRLAGALTASRLQTLLHIEAMYALPYFFNGLKIAASMSVIGIVIGEFISSKDGLGHYILVAQSRSETAHIFTAVFVLCLVGLIPYGIAVACERSVKAWWRG
jgi:NitT/TauT family transport system permease protein